MSTTAARLLYFYGVHVLLLLAGCVLYLYVFQPHLLDKSAFLSAFVILVWTIYNNPFSSRIVGYDTVGRYRRVCLRRFRLFSITSLVVFGLLATVGHPMLRELWRRWTYVEAIKRLTLEEGTESVPYPSAEELGAAYTLYPHRREVPFIIGRMSAVLAFDDEVSNYNLFIANFLKTLDVARIADKYHSRADLDLYPGAIDPVVYLARVIVDAGGADLRSLTSAVALLENHRKDDRLAQLHQFILRHEILELDPKGAAASTTYPMLLQEAAGILEGIKRQESPKTLSRLVTAHAFQEFLDHYAQLHIETEGTTSSERVHKIVQLYARVLTVRERIAKASEVPWFEAPGKLTVFLFFRHKVGRETTTTQRILSFLNTVPGLEEELSRRLVEAEAFKEYRSLETWYRGTPLGSTYAGKGMHDKLTEWLKTGW